MQFQVEPLLPVSSGSRLPGDVPGVPVEPHGAHDSRGVGPAVAEGIHHRQAHEGRGNPSVGDGASAALVGDKPSRSRTSVFFQYFHDPDVVLRLHPRFRRRGGPDGRPGDEHRVRRNVVDIGQDHLSGLQGAPEVEAPLLHAAPSAASQNCSAQYGGFSRFFRYGSFLHRLSPPL
ncbi:hypothetical protein SDC9_101758 [bioreactor metagenome]|uniref:Uncharacterized protein n=1 Tax=bioreactor metagenome TaxID=1076179 RepID=A0A645AP08_9ZZZZ